MTITKMTISELSQLTGMHRNTISSKLETAGLPFEPGKQGAKLYEVRKALPALYSSSQDDAVSEAKLAQEKLQLTAAKRQLAELDLATKENKLVDIQTVLEVVAEDYNYLKSQFLSLGASVARDIIHAKNAVSAAEIINSKVDEILSAIKVDSDRLLSNETTIPVEPQDDDEQL